MVPVFILMVLLCTLLLGCHRQDGTSAAASTASLSSPPPTASATTTLKPSPTPSFQSRLQKIQVDKTLTDSDKIRRITQLFFEAKGTNFKDDGDGVDLSVFISSSDHFSHNKIINFAKLSREGRQLAGIKLTNDNLTLMIYEVTLHDDTATVSLGEVYAYQLAGVQDPSTQRFGYNVHMIKEHGSWLITRIDTDNEAYTDDLGSDSYNVDKALQEGLARISAASTENNMLDKTPTKSNSGTSSKVSFHPINRADAAAYANKYALDYNSAQFISWSSCGGDCADFASQCAWYGMGGRQTAPSSYEPPMLALWNMAGDGYPQTSSFISMSAFFAMINTDYPATVPHVAGDCYEQGAVATAAPGDMIQLYNGSDWFHTYVVASVKGVEGSRTPSDIQISAHNSDIQNVNFYMQWAQGHPNAYRLIHLNGVYY